MEGNIKNKSEVLRAQDIIPSAESKSEQCNSANDDIPRFDLATEIMAQQRKLTSVRRKRPENKVQTVKEDLYAKPSAAFTEVFAVPTSIHTSIIAEIVERDIQRMLLSHSRLRG
jgi:hypothetical protein